jgi:hypothetical protein
MLHRKLSGGEAKLEVVFQKLNDAGKNTATNPFRILTIAGL